MTGTLGLAGEGNPKAFQGDEPQGSVERTPGFLGNQKSNWALIRAYRAGMIAVGRSQAVLVVENVCVWLVAKSLFSTL